MLHHLTQVSLLYLSIFVKFSSNTFTFKIATSVALYSILSEKTADRIDISILVAVQFFIQHLSGEVSQQDIGVDERGLQAIDHLILRTRSTSHETLGNGGDWNQEIRF